MEDTKNKTEDNLKHKSLTVNALLNVIRQCFGIIFPLITYPYISRTLGAANLGTYSFADSVTQIMLLVSTLGIPTYAIREGAMIRDDKTKIIRFSSEIFTINILSMFLAYSILLVLVMAVPRINRDAVIIGTLSINFLTTLVGRDWINSIYEDYLYISLRYIAVHLLSLALILLFIKSPDDLYKYVIIMMFSSAGGNVLNCFYTRRYVPIAMSSLKSLRSHITPVLILFCNSLATTIYIRSDITMLGFMTSDTEVGIYTLSSKVYLIVKSVLNAIIMVTIPRLANYKGKNRPEAKKQYLGLLIKLRNILVAFIFPAAVGLFSLRLEIMHIIGGNEYIEGNIALGILSFALIFAVLACFMANCILIIDRKENLLFKASLISAFLNIVLNFIMIPTLGIEGTAITTLISEITVTCIFLWGTHIYQREITRELIRVRIKDIVSILGECIIIVIASEMIKLIVDSAIIRVSFTILFSIAAYMIIVLIFSNKEIIDAVRNYMGREKK